MKVRELVRKLEGMPPDMRVIAEGPLGGIGDIYEIEMVKVVLDFACKGDHQIVTEENKKIYAGYPQHHAVYIR